MTDKTQNNKEFKKLAQFIEGLPDYLSGINAGFVEYMERADEILYQEEIKKLFELLDFFDAQMKEENKLRLEAITGQIDRILMGYELKNSRHINKALQEELSPFTTFMEPTKRELLLLRKNIIDLVCWFYGIYGLIATIKAFKKVTGLKGFDFIIKYMEMQQTSLKWHSLSLYELEKACRYTDKYKFEDHISTVNRGILELKEKGLDLNIPPIEFKDIRPNTKTVAAIAESGRFFGNRLSLEGYYLIYVYVGHEAYYEQVKNKYKVYERLLLENERELYPDLYNRNRD